MTTYVQFLVRALLMGLRWVVRFREPDRSLKEKDWFNLMGPSESQSASNNSMI